jgi:hypothetical protein
MNFNLILLCILIALYAFLVIRKTSKYAPMCGAQSDGTYRECRCGGRCAFSDNRGALGTCV